MQYRMRQKLASLGDDFRIEDNRGNRVYRVDGKALRLRNTMIFEDAQGNELAKIQEHKVRIRDAIEIEDGHGNNIASVKKAMITPLRERWSVKMNNGPDLSVQGNILDHEYTIEADCRKVAEVSKKWSSIRIINSVATAQRGALDSSSTPVKPNLPVASPCSRS
jgi:uncharacterized protein YxjI